MWILTVLQIRPPIENVDQVCVQFSVFEVQRPGLCAVSVFGMCRLGLGRIVELLTTKLDRNLKQLYFTQFLAK